MHPLQRSPLLAALLTTMLVIAPYPSYAEDPPEGGSGGENPLASNPFFMTTSSTTRGDADLWFSSTNVTSASITDLEAVNTILIMSTVAGFVTLGILTVSLVFSIVLAQGRTEDAQHYIGNNRTLLEQDLALGAGESIDDLANFFAVRPEHRARFGSAMRRARPEILPTLRAHRDDLTLQKTADLLNVIIAHMLQDPALAIDLYARGRVELHVHWHNQDP
jgi:hypothetical protein